MSLPSSIYPLTGCTTLFNNTLYAYSQDGLQSLPLRDGGQWQQLPKGASVEGGVCVKAVPGNDATAAALYIVGGSSNDSSYTGLQRFRFRTQQWETLRPTVLVTQNRRWHGATYLNATDMLVVYAGSQDGNRSPSTQTFTIQASEPYAVLAYQSSAPPATEPILLPWSSSDAMYVGGSDRNNKVMRFNPSSGWVDAGVSLSKPLQNTTTEKCVLVTGDDGSKNLYTFDMSVSPNAVNRTVLVDGNGAPVPVASPVAKRDHRDDEALAARALTVADWPTYNSSNVPTATRTQYSLAQDESGRVVISGGNDSDEMCIFEAKQNAWSRVRAVLGISSTATTISASSSSIAKGTSSPTTSNTVAPSPDRKSHGSNTNMILAAVLGSVVSALLILTVALIFIKWRRKRRAGHLRRSSGLPSEKDSFSDTVTMLPQSTTGRQFKPHMQHASMPSDGSQNSMAILMGRKGHQRGGEKNGSNSSSQISRIRNAISKPIPQEQPAYNFQPSTQPPIVNSTPIVPNRKISFSTNNAAPPARPRAGKKDIRSSAGWSKYWSGASNRNTIDSDAPSQYSEDMQELDAKILPPRQPHLQRVNSGSPTVSISHAPTGYNEMVGQIGRQSSTSSAGSWYDDGDGDGDGNGAYHAHGGGAYRSRRGTDAYTSGVPASEVDLSSWQLPPDRTDWSTLSPLSTLYPPPPSASAVSSMSKSTQHTATIGGAGSGLGTRRPSKPVKPFSEDMSWLNLGAGARPA